MTRSVAVDMPSVSSTKAKATKGSKVAKSVAKVAKSTKATNGLAKVVKASPAPRRTIARRARAEHSPLRSVLGENLKAARLAKKMTHHKLSDQTRVSQNYIRLIEEGTTNTSLDVIDVIAGALGKTAAALISPPRAKNSG